MQICGSEGRGQQTKQESTKTTRMSRQTKDVLATLKPAHSETKPDTKVKQTRNTALLI